MFKKKTLLSSIFFLSSTRQHRDGHSAKGERREEGEEHREHGDDSEDGIEEDNRSTILLIEIVLDDRMQWGKSQ